MFFWSVQKQQNELYRYLRRPTSSIQVSDPKILAFCAVYQFSWFRGMYALNFSTLTHEFKVVRIKEKIAKILRCSDFKSGTSKV